MQLDLTPISKLEMGQFSVSVDDLPVLEKTKVHGDGQMYRSSKHPNHVFIWRKSRGEFDCYVMG